MSHTIEAAMKRGELTEEEAYFILRFAGHYGYAKSIRRIEGKPWWKWAARWCVWFGGWCSPCLCQWDLGFKAFHPFERDSDGKLRLTSPTPLALFGHRITFFDDWLQFRLKPGVWVVANYSIRRRTFYAYWSENGTPPDGNGRPQKGRFFFKRTWKPAASNA